MRWEHYEKQSAGASCGSRKSRRPPAWRRTPWPWGQKSSAGRRVPAGPLSMAPPPWHSPARTRRVPPARPMMKTMSSQQAGSSCSTTPTARLSGTGNSGLSPISGPSWKPTWATMPCSVPWPGRGSSTPSRTIQPSTARRAELPHASCPRVSGRWSKDRKPSTSSYEPPGHLRLQMSRPIWRHGAIWSARSRGSLPCLPASRPCQIDGSHESRETRLEYLAGPAPHRVGKLKAS